MQIQVTNSRWLNTIVTFRVTSGRANSSECMEQRQDVNGKVTARHTVTRSHAHFPSSSMLAAVAKEQGKLGNPLKRLAYHSTATCSAQAAVYGKCIVATYTDVTKGVCRDEFLYFKRCLEKAVCSIFQSMLLPVIINP